jgi:hypothetical protein
MITDKLNMFSEGQADIRTAGSYLSDKSIDLGLAAGLQALDLGEVFVKIGTAFAGGTSLAVEIITASNAALSADVKVVQSSGAILTADLKANSMPVKMKMPVKLPGRYLGLRYVGVGNFSAGDLTAGLTPATPTN